MRRYGIRLIAHALDGTPVPGEPWLKTYTPDAQQGRGEITTTPHARDALRFPDTMAAMACWHRVPTTHPRRPDGRPNKPLTAYTVSIEPIPEEETR